MEVEEQKNDKLFYSIGEVAEMFGVNTSLIRFWEKEFDVIKPKKNAKGNRLFTVKDIQNFKLIYHLVKEQRMTLDGARQKLKSNKDGAESDLEIINKLKSIKEQLLEIRKEL
mgnify:CR=1 FL=1